MDYHVLKKVNFRFSTLSGSELYILQNNVDLNQTKFEHALLNVLFACYCAIKCFCTTHFILSKLLTDPIIVVALTDTSLLKPNGSGFCLGFSSSCLCAGYGATLSKCH